MVRQAAVDAIVGAAAFVLMGGVLLLQGVSMRAVEVLLIVLPAIVFPVAVLIRSRRRDRRAVPFGVISAWSIVALVVVAHLANAPVSSLVMPIAVCIASCGIAAVAPRSVGIAIIVAFAITLAFAEPAIWSDMLTRDLRATAPDVTLVMRDGSQIRLDQLRGHVVVLNFWGVWCGPCVRELPELDAVARTETRGSFFAVNSGLGGETAAQVDAFIATRHAAVPVVYDFDRRVYKAFAIKALPTTVIIDRSGMIRLERVGFASTANFESWLRRSVSSIAGS